MPYPLSIFVLYSPSRRRQFEQFARLLTRCDRYSDCQKILVADNRTDIRPSDYETLVVPRQGNHFCWSDAWAAAMAAVSSDKVLYLDCDRILPDWYLTHIIDTLRDYEFVYPLHLWNMSCDLPDEALLDRDLLFRDYGGQWTAERLTAEYNYLPCRGPLSGTSAFTVKSYQHIGPLDRSYLAWGYPDLEYQEAIKTKGCIFRPVDTEVIHLHHGYEIEPRLFHLVNAWNGVRFFKKWKLFPTPMFMNYLKRHRLTAEYLLSITIDELLAKPK